MWYIYASFKSLPNGNNRPICENSPNQRKFAQSAKIRPIWSHYPVEYHWQKKQSQDENAADSKLNTLVFTGKKR
jgi:hypothetical protein